MRFPLRWLFIAILLVAVSIVALMNANEHWAGAARTSIILLLALAAVFGYLASGKDRAFWLGFALVGIAHFASTRFAGFNYSAEGYNHVVADAAIEWLHRAMAHDEQMEIRNIIGQAVMQVEKRPHIHQFRIVGRCIIVVPLAMLGGCIAMWFYSRRDPRPVRSDKVSDKVTDHT